MDFGDLSDNPFSIELAPRERSNRRAMIAAAKLLLLVAAGLAVTLVVASQSQKWLLHRLMHDFDSISGDEKQSRLIQVAELGPRAIEPLVRTLADDDTTVARTAYELLRQSQNNWTVLGRNTLHERHAIMVDALESIAVHMPDDRTGWGTSLLQQTIMATVDREDEASRGLYRDATHALQLMSLSQRSGPSILSDDPLDPMTPRRLTIKSRPLPVSAVASVDRWTDWPPPQAESSQRESNESGERAIAAGTNEIGSVAESASVYRSSAGPLQPLPSDEAVILREPPRPHETGFQPDEIQSVSHLVDSPMDTFDDKSVMHWLGSPHQALREQARDELVSRGYSNTELSIATQISAGDPRTRMELIDAIVRSDAIDPRPWLLMMLGDENRDVKLRVVSVLATMNDPSVSQRLRMHLIDERDPTIAARIRRVLDLR